MRYTSGMEQYKTLAGAGESALVDRKSRFLGFAAPFDDVPAAERYLADLRKRFAAASHVVFAFRLVRPEQYSRFSDDGEPKGTAGPPLLDVLTAAGLVQCGVFVVRYFGGTLLGTGGLVRAYGKAAAAAVEAAGVVTMTKARRIDVRLAYDISERVQDGLKRAGFMLSDVRYADEVRVTAAVPMAEAERFRTLLDDLSAGRADCRELGDGYLNIGKDATI